MINKLQTFYNYKTDPGNVMATAAAKAVVEGSVMNLNPLVIYGPRGTGKTHLLNAIGNNAELENPEAVVLLTSAKALFLRAEGAYPQGNDLFREMYETADYLLIDDLNKIPEGPQELEALNLLKDIVENGGKVVITSRYSPAKIAGIPPEFYGFLTSGFIVDMQKAERKERNMPDIGFTTEKVINIDEEEKRIAIAAVGGCGGYIQGSILPSKLPEASYIAIDTHLPSLEKRRGVKQIFLKDNSLDEECLEEVFGALKGFDYIFLLAGLGGETGSGVLSALLRSKDEFDAEIVPIVTMPFSFEGHKRDEIADAVLDEIRESSEIYGILYNDMFMSAGDSATGFKDILIDCSKTVTSMIQLLLRILPLETDTMFGISKGSWRFEQNGLTVAKLVINR